VVRGCLCLLTLGAVGLEKSSGSSVLICPFDGLPCDGKLILGAPSCSQSVFGTDSRGRALDKTVDTFPRFKSGVRPKF
jgi:hypothetical protein